MNKSKFTFSDLDCNDLKSNYFKKEWSGESADEFISTTEYLINKLFYTSLSPEKSSELIKQYKEIDQLLIKLTGRMTPEYLDAVEGEALRREDIVIFLRQLRRQNNQLVDHVSRYSAKQEYDSTLNELIAQISSSYERLFRERPTYSDDVNTGVLFHYMHKVFSLMKKNDEVMFPDSKIAISKQRIKSVLDRQKI